MSRCRGKDLQSEFPRYCPGSSITRLLVEGLQKNGNALAMADGDTGRSVSSAELLEQSVCIAAGLRGAGLAPGDCVVLCCDKSIMSFSFLLATMFVGATAVLVPTTHADRIHQVTKGHNIKAVIFDPKYERPVLDKSVPLLEYTPFLIAELDQDDTSMTKMFDYFEEFEVYEASDTSKHVPLVLFSGGTTGEPKAIKMSDIGLQIVGISVQAVRTILTASPMFWFSSTVFLISTILQNFTLIFTNTGDTQEVLKIIQEHKIRTLFVSPATLLKYTHEPSLQKYDFSSIEHIVIGGDLVSRTVARAFVDTVLKGYVKLQFIYGATEAGLLTKCEDIEVQCNTGYLMPGVEIKIVDDGGWVVPIGHMGQVMSRSPGLTPGYWDGKRRNLDNEGFLPLADVGFMDKNGHIHLRGRAVDMIEYRGRKVSPCEIEDVLLGHEGVANAAVVGRPHPSDGQRPAAFVVRRAGHDVTADQLVAFVDGKLEDEKKLRGGVIFIKQFPLTIIGKISRKALRDIFH